MKLKNVEDIYPLSPMQDLMLFYTLSAPNSGVLSEQVSLTLQGKLELAAFQKAWQIVVNRHTILRTSFLWEGLKSPLQVVRQQVELPWEISDWRAMGEKEQQARLHDLLSQDRNRAFDLTKAPLLRFTLIRLQETSYQFVLSFHHLLMDGWCLPLIFRECMACYHTIQQGTPIDLEPAVPYRKYIAWLKTQSEAEAENYWRQTLKDFRSPLLFEKRLDDASIQSERERYNDLQTRLSVEATKQLQSLAQKHHLTLNTIVQGGWAFLLFLLSGRHDLVFGATFSGRPVTIDGVEAIIGPFIANLPIRISLDLTQPLYAWLKTLQQRIFDTRQYEYCPLGRIQQWSELPPGIRLFETLVIFENYPTLSTDEPQSQQELEIAAIESEVRTNYPLSLVAVPGPQLLLRLSYDRASIEHETIQDLLACLATILTEFATMADQPLAMLPAYREMLWQDRLDGAQLLKDWNEATYQRSASNPLLAPRNPLEEQLISIWEDVLGITPLGISDNFFEVGGNSFLATHLVSQMKEQFGQQLSLATFFQSPTVEAIAQAISQGNVSQTWSPLIPLRSTGSRPPFFCIHPGTGGVFCYGDMARHLDPEQPFYGLQARGLDGQERPLTRTEELAACYIQAMRQIQPQSPYFLGGHCFGGVVAFEMARQLKLQGCDVALLVIMDTAPPRQRPAQDQHAADSSEEFGDIGALAQVIEEFVGKTLSIDYQTLSTLSNKQQLAYLLERLKAKQVVAPQTEAAQLRGLLQVSQANSWAYSSYIPQVSSHKITLIRASELFIEEDSAVDYKPYTDAAFGWGAYSQAAVDVHIVPGNHVTMLTEPHAQALAERLQDCLFRAQEESTCKKIS